MQKEYARNYWMNIWIFMKHKVSCLKRIMRHKADTHVECLICFNSGAFKRIKLTHSFCIFHLPLLEKDDGRLIEVIGIEMSDEFAILLIFKLHVSQCMLSTFVVMLMDQMFFQVLFVFYRIQHYIFAWCQLGL